MCVCERERGGGVCVSERETDTERYRQINTDINGTLTPFSIPLSPSPQGRSRAQMRADYKQCGDLGDVAHKARASVRTLVKPKPLTVKGRCNTWNAQTDRHRQTDRQTDRQAGRQAGRQTHTHTRTQTHTNTHRRARRHEYPPSTRLLLLYRLVMVLMRPCGGAGGGNMTPQRCSKPSIGSHRCEGRVR